MIRFLVCTLLVLATELSAASDEGQNPEVLPPPTAEEIQRRLTDKVFDWSAPGAGPARIEFKANGFAFLNAGAFADSGKWRVEGDRVCVEWRRGNAGCSEARAKGEVIYLKRPNGVWATMSPR